MQKIYQTRMRFLQMSLIHQKRVLSSINKRKFYKGAINKEKILGDKIQWTHGSVDKASNKTLIQIYAEYKQHKLNKKDEKMGKALGKHVISMYLTEIFVVVNIKDVKKLQQNTEKDPIIKWTK